MFCCYTPLNPQITECHTPTWFKCRQQCMIATVYDLYFLLVLFLTFFLFFFYFYSSFASLFAFTSTSLKFHWKFRMVLINLIKQLALEIHNWKFCHCKYLGICLNGHWICDVMVIYGFVVVVAVAVVSPPLSTLFLLYFICLFVSATSHCLLALWYKM